MVGENRVNEYSTYQNHYKSIHVEAVATLPKLNYFIKSIFLGYFTNEVAKKTININITGITLNK